MVRTPGFHPGNRGSIPRGGTSKHINPNNSKFNSRFFNSVGIEGQQRAKPIRRWRGAEKSKQAQDFPLPRTQFPVAVPNNKFILELGLKGS